MPAEAADFRADVLAIAAHRDDVEQTCGGTLLRMAARGLRTAILDLTQGEAGTRGTAAERAREAEEAARVLGVGWRQALDLPDGAVENTLENRIAIVRVLRLLRPRAVILPYWQARHPDHAMVATLGYEACFLSGLKKVGTGVPTDRFSSGGWNAGALSDRSSSVGWLTRAADSAPESSSGASKDTPESPRSPYPASPPDPPSDSIPPRPGSASTAPRCAHPE